MEDDVRFAIATTPLSLSQLPNQEIVGWCKDEGFDVHRDRLSDRTNSSIFQGNGVILCSRPPKLRDARAVSLRTGEKYGV
jgi:hypothetical protein